MESSEREYERMSDGGSQMSGKSKTADVDAGDKLGDGSTSSATEPSGTIGSSILNLLNSVMGVGILALVRRCTSHSALRTPRSRFARVRLVQPAAFEKTGAALGVSLLTVSAILVVGTLLVLDSTLRMTSSTTYSEAVANAAGRTLAKVLPLAAHWSTSGGDAL